MVTIGACMKRNTLISTLKALGLRVDLSGLVTDGAYEFGMVNAMAFVTMKGDKLLLKDIRNAEYLPIEHKLTLDDDSEEGTTIRGALSQVNIVEDIPVYDMPKSLTSMIDAFPILFPDYKDFMVYDELKEKDMIDIRLFDPDAEPDVLPMDDRLLVKYHEEVERRLDLHGFVGKTYPSNKIRDEALMAMFYKNAINPFRDWVESHEWDGKERLRMWFRRQMGATAPPLQDDPEAELKYIGDVTEAWFMGGISRMYRETQHDIIPVFIGAQRIGKGYNLRFLAGDDSWYVGTSSEIDKPQDFLDSVRGAVIVELAEATQLYTSDNGKLKAFISQTRDQFRKAYARYDGSYPRHFIIAASSNMKTLFTDITGAERFFPMFCDGRYALDPTPTYVRGDDIQYEVEQVWAEALHKFREGGTCHLSLETQALANVVQRYYTAENPGITAIDEYLDDPVNGYTKVGSRITRAMIFAEVFGVNPNSLSREVETAYRAWLNGTVAWSKTTKPCRIAGKTQRGFERILPPGKTPKKKTVNLVYGRDEDIRNAKTPLMLMRRVVDMWELHTGELVPHNVLMKDDAEALINAGYIEVVYDGGQERYSVKVLP